MRSNDTVDLALPHLVKQVLDGWPLKVGPAIPVVDELQYLHILDALHSVNILMDQNANADEKVNHAPA